MAEVDTNSVKSSIEEIRTSILPHQSIDCDIAAYTGTHLHLAQLYFYLEEYKKTFYHLSECHSTLLRRYGVLEGLRKEGCFGVSLQSSNLKWKHLCPAVNDDERDVELFKRLSEMPSEWTIVQLSRIPQDNEFVFSQDTNPKLKQLFISRAQCGENPEETLVGYIDVPYYLENILDELNKASEQLSFKGMSRHIIRAREKASNVIEDYIKTLDDDLFMDWKCLFCGELEDKYLKKNIRNKIDRILRKYSVKLTLRDKTLLYLMSEGIFFYKPIVIKSHIELNMSSNLDEAFKNELYIEMISLKSEYPDLETARRHPVILIIEDHLDIVPWENMPILKDQPVTRNPSVHFLYALYNTHKKHINNGLREINEGKVNCYVVNPDSDLVQSEQKLKPFFQARLPNWRNVIGQKPSPTEIIQLLTSSNTYMYCGHGSGRHLLQGYDPQHLDLKNSVQFLFGCKSAALTFLGGVIPMMGDMLHFSIAGSACSVGMLYVVMSNDADTMAMDFTNIWLPGTPVNPNTLQPILSDTFKEPELLRVISRVRKIVKLASNGLGFIARGLPVKLVSSKH